MHYFDMFIFNKTSLKKKKKNVKVCTYSFISRSVHHIFHVKICVRTVLDLDPIVLNRYPHGSSHFEIHHAEKKK